MADVKLTVSAPKEVVDVLVALDSLVGKIVAKEPAFQIISEEIGALISLVGEMGALPSDVALHSDEVLDAVAIYLRRVAYRLLSKPVTPVVVG